MCESVCVPLPVCVYIGKGPSAGSGLYGVCGDVMVLGPVQDHTGGWKQHLMSPGDGGWPCPR